VIGRYDTEIRDRRQGSRFQIRLRCLLHLGAFSGIPGIAENISRMGMLVRCEGAALWAKIDPAEPVQIGLEISSPGSLSKKRILDCQGSVTWREEQPSGDMLLGLTISKMRFRNAPPGTSASNLWNSDGELVM